MPYSPRDEYRQEGGAAGAARAAAARAATELGGEDGEAWEVRAAASVERLREAIQACNRRIAPLVEKEGAHVNQYWGYISRAGWADKSHLMRQIEKYADIFLALASTLTLALALTLTLTPTRYADIYTSRVSNLLPYSPYMRFTTSPQSLGHEQPQKHWAINAADDASFERAAAARVPSTGSESESELTLTDEEVRSSDVYKLIYKEDRSKYRSYIDEGDYDSRDEELIISDWDDNKNSDMWSDPNTPSDKKRSGPQPLG